MEAGSGVMDHEVASGSPRAAHGLGVYELASFLKHRYIHQFIYSHTKSSIFPDNLTAHFSYHPNPRWSHSTIPFNMSGAQFTDRANKALLDSSGLCEQYAHSQILPLHLAVALLNPSPGESEDQQPVGHASHDGATAPLFRQVIERAHGDSQLLDRALMKLLVRLPSQDPPPENPSVSPQLAKVIRSATDLSKTQKDSFVAVDHLIQSVCQDSQVQRALADANIPNLKLIDTAIQQIRGTSRVDSKTADAEERE